MVANEKTTVVKPSSVRAPIYFKSLDGLLVRADIYIRNSSLPTIILCHQARSGRGEFFNTADRMNEFGFNCLALDLRSGGNVHDIVNETHANAEKLKLPTDYLAAWQDIKAAIKFVSEKLPKSEIVLLGSSYSASLVMFEARNNSKVKAVAAFSPGNYFDGKIDFGSAIKGLDKPLFLTSSKEESQDVANLGKGLSEGKKTQYIPETEGIHGAKALWPTSDGTVGYWGALERWLKDLKL